MMPHRAHCSNSSSCWPKAGFTSPSAFSKSSLVTEIVPKSLAELAKLWTSTFRLSAKEVAERMRPSSSAPEKFLVCPAMAGRDTELSKYPFSRIDFVWMLRICTRPASSGKLISTWTSKRPGLKRASSMRSIRLVMPMSKMLFSESTPSILDNSWFTMLSWTPVLSDLEPRDLQMESISSKMTTCSCEFSPCILYSFSASANRFLMFSSAWPTYLFRISGPLTIFGSAALRNLASCRAMSVLPVPGGPCNNMPRTWLMPRSRTTCGGNTRAAKARLKMLANSLSRPPIPSSSKLKSGRKMLRCWTLLLRMCSFPEGPCWKSTSVCSPNSPACTFFGALPSTSTGAKAATASFNTWLLKSMAMVCEVEKTCPRKRSRKTFSRSSSLISTLGASADGFWKKSTSTLHRPRSKPFGA
mmetsp:Transcript_95108/g.273837  ORF Transcript_95108/g.273837 Transcript_95108/m.273837 type:complete len:414 (+) Transcript_95108:822-2063(+)